MTEGLHGHGFGSVVGRGAAAWHAEGFVPEQRGLDALHQHFGGR